MRVKFQSKTSWKCQITLAKYLAVNDRLLGLDMMLFYLQSYNTSKRLLIIYLATQLQIISKIFEAVCRLNINQSNYMQ